MRLVRALAPALMALCFVASPASATVVFEGFAFQFYTYAEAGGTGADGDYHYDFQDLTGQASASTLPAAPLEDVAHASASFTNAAGTLLASASATGHSTATFASAGDLTIVNAGSSTQIVTAAGGLDPEVFAGSAPMYVYVAIYAFLLDTPTTLDFTYAGLLDSQYETQFSLGGPTGYFDNLSGNGSISQVLSPGSYELYLFDYDFGGGGYLESAGSMSDVTGRSYALTLSAVPEAATWIMMMAGLFMIGLALRRDRARFLTRALPDDQCAIPRRMG